MHRFLFNQGTITQTNWLPPPPDSNKVAYVLKMSEILGKYLRPGRECEVHITFTEMPAKDVTA